MKALQQRANKVRERHQCRTTQLDEFQDIGEQLGMKELNTLQATKESHKQVTNKVTWHPMEQHVEECVEVKMNSKTMVDEVKQ